MKAFVFILIGLVAITAKTLSQAVVLAGTYYVDAFNGNDAFDGTSPKKAWKNLSAINSRVFSAGAKILFSAGGVWQGQLKPKGSGTLQRPIIIDKFGKGPLPIINGMGIEHEGVVYLYNQSYWEINHLEIINDAPTPGDRRGVEINGANYGIINHVYLKNLTIHNIKGKRGHNAEEKKTAGIYFTVSDDKIMPTRFHDILIEDCSLYSIENEGIVTNNEVSQSDYPGTPEWEKRKITQLVIRNNTLHHISKNAMIVRLADKGIVERNLCYETALGMTGNTIYSRSCKGTVFQYNEGYANRSPDFDGSLYDADLSSPGTIWQYSYSHDNAHGLMWFCTDKRDTGIIVRYNISQNDHGKLIYFNYPFQSATVYNNVFYTDSNLSPILIAENGKNNHSYQCYNNIFYNKSANAAYGFALTTDKGIQSRDISHNLFYRNHPDSEPKDPFKIVDDPMFINPGKGKAGLSSLKGYQLQQGSPAIKKGKEIIESSLIDFFRNPVINNDHPNIGADNGRVADTKTNLRGQREKRDRQAAVVNRH